MLLLVFLNCDSSAGVAVLLLIVTTGLFGFASRYPKQNFSHPPKVSDNKTSQWVFMAGLRPQFRMPAVWNAPELRSQHDAALPVQLQYPGERRAAAAMPLPESP